LVKDRERNNRSKGYCFVEYVSLESAIAAVQKFNGQFKVGTRTLRADFTNEFSQGEGGGPGGPGGGGRQQQAFGKKKWNTNINNNNGNNAGFGGFNQQLNYSGQSYPNNNAFNNNMINNSRPQKQQQPQQQQQQKFYQQQSQSYTPPPTGPVATTQPPSGPAALAPSNDGMSQSYGSSGSYGGGSASLGPVAADAMGPQLTATDSISAKLAQVPAPNLLQFLGSAPTLLAQNPAQLADALRASPALTYAALQAMLRMGLVDNTVVAHVVNAASAAAAAGVPYNYLDELKNNPPGASQQQQVPQLPLSPKAPQAPQQQEQYQHQQLHHQQQQQNFPPPPPPPTGPGGTDQQQQAALLAQVLQLPDDQLAMLPADQQAMIRQLRASYQG
jgi:hypothetical protein